MLVFAALSYLMLAVAVPYKVLGWKVRQPTLAFQVPIFGVGSRKDLRVLGRPGVALPLVVLFLDMHGIWRLFFYFPILCVCVDAYVLLCFCLLLHGSLMCTPKPSISVVLVCFFPLPP